MGIQAQERRGWPCGEGWRFMFAFSLHSPGSCTPSYIGGNRFSLASMVTTATQSVMWQSWDLSLTTRWVT